MLNYGYRMRLSSVSVSCLVRQGEVEVLLDLVAAVEAGQHLAVANVPPRKNTLEGLTAPRAVRLQAKQQQLQVQRPTHPSLPGSRSTYLACQRQSHWRVPLCKAPGAKRLQAKQQLLVGCFSGPLLPPSMCTVC